jgi:hypothetical protein
LSYKDNLARGFNHIVEKAGNQVRVRYFNQTFDDTYDDSVILTQSGTDVWTSGIILPLSSKYGSIDSVLFEQGKLIYSDKKVYLHGSLLLTGSELQVKIQIGSPIGENYSLLPDGTLEYQAENQSIYKKAYLRRLTGSLLGE